MRAGVVDFALTPDSRQIACVYEEDMSIRLMNLLDDSLHDAITTLHEGYYINLNNLKTC